MKEISTYQFTFDELAHAFEIYVIDHRANPQRYSKKRKAQLSAAEVGREQARFFIDLMQNGESAFKEDHSIGRKEA